MQKSKQRINIRCALIRYNVNKDKLHPKLSLSIEFKVWNYSIYSNLKNINVHFEQKTLFLKS